MDVGTVIDIAREALWIIIKASAPMLIVSLVVGLVVSVFQTVTSIQDQTLSFVPKIIAVFVTIIVCGGWVLTIIVEYMKLLYSNFSTYIG